MPQYDELVPALAMDAISIPYIGVLHSRLLEVIRIGKLYSDPKQNRNAYASMLADRYELYRAAGGRLPLAIILAEYC